MLKTVNAMTMNSLSCLPSELFLMRAASMPEGALQVLRANF